MWLELTISPSTSSSGTTRVSKRSPPAAGPASPCARWPKRKFSPTLTSVAPSRWTSTSSTKACGAVRRERARRTGSRRAPRRQARRRARPCARAWSAAAARGLARRPLSGAGRRSAPRRRPGSPRGARGARRRTCRRPGAAAEARPLRPRDLHERKPTKGLRSPSGSLLASAIGPASSTSRTSSGAPPGGSHVGGRISASPAATRTPCPARRAASP